jgi:REP element-mobilizing transposase RayT
MSNEFRIYRRTLPHWRQDGATYFVTWRLHQCQPQLSPQDRTIVANAIDYFNRQRYQLAAYVVMDDHVHVVVTPFGNVELSAILHSWKSFTSHRLVKTSDRTAPVWQDESYNRIMRNREELDEKVIYTATNPVRRWPDCDSYAWVQVYEDWG